MFARKLLLAAASALLSLLAAEAIVRATDLDRRVLGDPLRDGPFLLRMLVPDPVLLWRGRPHYRSPGLPAPLNERGFRGPAPGPHKAANVARIAVLGDSCTFGVVMRDGAIPAFPRPYPELLQELLDRAPGGERFEVINYALIGYTSWHGLRLLRTQVLTDAPDVVVIRFGWNDHFGSTLGRSLSSFRDPVLERLEEWAYRSRLVALLTYRGIPQARVDRDAWTASPKPTVWVTAEDYAFNLSRTVELAHAHGARVILLDAPAAPLTPEILANRDVLGASGYDSFGRLLEEHARYQAIAAAVARERGVPFLRTLPAGPPESNGYFGRYDFAHPDARGHARIARILLEEILRLAGRRGPD